MAYEVVSLDQAKDYLRVDGTTEDTLIKALISAVSKKIEDYTGRYFVQRAITETHIGDGLKELRLYRQPVSSIASVTIDGTEFDTYTDWSHIGRLKVSAGWTRGCLIVVTYTAGYGANIAAVQAALPDLLMAALLIISDLYENRSDKAGSINIAGVGSTSYNLPSRAAEILSPLRTELFT